MVMSLVYFRRFGVKISLNSYGLVGSVNMY